MPDLRVVSFNIRNCTAPDGRDHWDHRRDLVVRTLLDHDADLIGLQEGRFSQISFLREQLLDEWGIDLAINNPLGHSQKNRHPGYLAALCSATNDWQLAEWTEPEPRPRGWRSSPAQAPG